MLPKKYRLTVGFFKNLVTENKKPNKIIDVGIFSAKVYSSGNKFSRFAVVMSSANFKKATERNRLRRMVYEIINKKEIHKLQGRDFVFFLRKKILKADSNELKSEISKSLSSVI
ncbi:MAG: ribonuclease P protein component [Candidatus Paceibacterota bacterium]|jgi:ribonuclease P protein component